jgi:MSHA biogenesis protein MshJ
MKRWWEMQSARINALSLRERVFLFLSIMACGMALADVFWLSPAQTSHKQLTQRFEKQSAELQRARNELKTVARPVDGNKAMRDEIAALNTRVDDVNQDIKDVLPSATEVTPLAQVLVHLLQRHAGLTLVRTSTMAPEAVVAKAVGAAATATPVGLTRQGVELTVSGPYPELMRYMQALEKALPHVRWGVMQLKSEKLPPELTLQLFLVGVQP